MSGDVIAAAISCINLTIDGVRKLSKASGAIERAELKLQLAEMMDALADAKLEMTQAMEDRAFFQQQIAELEKSLRIKETIKRAGDAYYGLDEQGEPKGAPYCSLCWERNHSLIHLTSAARTEQHSSCPACKSQYPRMTTHVR